MNIKDEIREKGYSFRDSHEVIKELDIKDGCLEKFTEEWDNLGEDRYLKDEYMFRYRRYGQIGLIPSRGKLWKRRDSKYFQSKEINSYIGGISRKFEPLTEQIVNNNSFKKIILTSFEKFGVEDEFLDMEWYADIHLFRLVARQDKDVTPTPEGIHRDGFPFGALHLINKENIEGGVSRVYTLNNEYLASASLTTPLDTFYIVDNKVKHFTTPFSSIDGNIGKRDILVYGFHLPGTKYKQG